MPKMVFFLCGNEWKFVKREIFHGTSDPQNSSKLMREERIGKG